MYEPYPVQEVRDTKNIQPVRMSDDITLHFQSISMLNGHAGVETVFQPSLHRAYQYTYLMNKKIGLARLLDKIKGGNGLESRCVCWYAALPETITTRQEAEDFLRARLPEWLR